MSKRKVNKKLQFHLFESIFFILSLVHGYFRRRCLEHFHSQTHIPALEITNPLFAEESGVPLKWETTEVCII